MAGLHVFDLLTFVLVTAATASELTRTACSSARPARVTENGASIVSPGWPGHYPARARCEWLVSGLPRTTVTVAFHSFNTADNYDCLQVFDGADQRAPQLAGLCGSRSPSPIRSSGNQLYLIFTSNWNRQYSGFSATVELHTLTDCPDPGTVRNGGRTITDTFWIGSQITYICDTGHKIQGGTAIRTCQENQHWSGSQPTCVPIECPAPEPPANGSVSVASPAFMGTMAMYSCNHAHHLTGSALATCQDNSHWSSGAPHCEEILCSALAAPPHGSVSLDQGHTTLDSVATYSCDAGFKMQGSFRRTCVRGKGDVGVWGGHQPQCSIISCPDPPAPSHGVVTGNTTYNDSVTYMCNAGYHLRGKATALCEEDGTWSHMPPICHENVCMDPGMPTNTGRLLSNQLYYGSHVTYSCFTGYKMQNGSNIRTCQENGRWSGTLPACIRITCQPLESPENGTVSMVSQAHVGAVATFSCNYGYHLSGSAFTTCKDTSHWSSGAPHCEKILCSALETPSHGSMSMAQGHTLDSVVTYSCDAGYRMQGSFKRTCARGRAAMGVWGGHQPSCNIIHCSDPPAPSNGAVTGNTTYNDSVTYMCNAGYHLTGKASALCEEDGTWSHMPPTCRESVCTDPGIPSDAGRMFSHQLNYGSQVTYICFTGYMMQDGSNIRTCQDNGSWSGALPSCIRITCQPPESPANGTVSVRSQAHMGAVATFSCNYGYHLSGSASTTCKNDSTWSTGTSHCQQIRCPAPDALPHGSITMSHGHSLDSVATQTCDAGYWMIGSPLRTCIQGIGHVGVWSGDRPHCSITRCPDPPAPSHGAVTGSTEYQATITYMCHRGFLLLGHETATCRADSTWSNMPPTCQDVNECENASLCTGYSCVNTYGSYICLPLQNNGAVSLGVALGMMCTVVGIVLLAVVFIARRRRVWSRDRSLPLPRVAWQRNSDGSFINITSKQSGAVESVVAGE